MANKLANRVKVTVSGTPGTGTITLGSAVSGFMDFATAGVSNGNTVPYVIEDSNAWEIGVGTYTSSGTTLARTSITASSSGGSAISATSNAIVMISPLAADLQAGTAANNLVQLDGTGKIPALDGSLITSLNATNITNGTLSVSRGGTGAGTAFTAGSVVYAGASGVYSQNNSGLFWDNTNTRLGIGTATPVARLDLGVPGNARFINAENGVDANFRVTFSTNTVTFANSGGGGVLAFQTSASEAMRIASNGSVGIGTASPSTKLDVYTASNGGIRVTDGSQVGIMYASGLGGIVSGTVSNHPYIFLVNNGEKARIDASGNLGLGVTPSAWGSGFRAIEYGKIGSSILSSTSSGNVFVSSNAYHNGSNWIYANNAPAVFYSAQSSSGNHIWSNAPSGTAGNAITFTQAMTLDASGNLGIGAAPSRRLTVAGAGSDARIEVINTSDSNRGGYLRDTGSTFELGTNSGVRPLAFAYDASEKMRIDSSGNVGIGTSSPQETLTVAKSSSGSLGPILSSWNTAANANNNAAAIGMRTSSDFTGANVYGGLIKTILTNAAGHANEMSFSLYSDGAGGLAERMRIDTNGNVGIGTSSPVSGKCLTLNNASNYYGITFQVAGTTQATIMQESTGTLYVDYNSINASGALVFRSNASEKARIDSSGNLLVNVTSVGVGKTTIYSTTNSQAAIDGRITASGDVGTRALYLSKFDNNSTTSQIFVQFAMNNAATGQGQINANGANAAAFGTYSDARLKENIVNLPSQLDNILALKPREFDYIESEGGGHQIGFIAQEMQQIYPDAVGERSDGMLTITAWSKTEARLVKAIQELAAKVSALEAKVA